MIRCCCSPPCAPFRRRLCAEQMRGAPTLLSLSINSLRPVSVDSRRIIIIIDMSLPLFLLAPVCCVSKPIETRRHGPPTNQESPGLGICSAAPHNQTDMEREMESAYSWPSFSGDVAHESRDRHLPPSKVSLSLCHAAKIFQPPQHRCANWAHRRRQFFVRERGGWKRDVCLLQVNIKKRTREALPNSCNES